MNIPTVVRNGITITTVKVRRYAIGYEVRAEFWDNGEGPIYIRSAYTAAGDYIGSPKDAFFLIRKKGILPQLRTPTSAVCSIGFCEKEQKWYGWSHRAIYGFAIGDSVQAGDCTDAAFPEGFTAETLEDAKRMAEAFAESVS